MDSTIYLGRQHWEGMDCLWRSVSPKIPWQSQLFEYLCALRLGCFLGPTSQSLASRRKNLRDTGFSTCLFGVATWVARG